MVVRSLQGGIGVLAQRQSGLLGRRQLLAAGFSARQIHRRVLSGRWLQVVAGVFDVMPNVSWLNDPIDHRRLRAAWTGLLAVEPHGISTGACSLALQGFWGLPQNLVPEVTIDGAIHQRGPAGVRVRRFVTGPRPLLLEDHRLVDPVRALIQALPEWGRDTAVAVLDSAINRRRICSDDLDRVKKGVRGRRGAARLHGWWPLVDGAAESPIETRARLQCLDAGLPRPQLQVVLRHEGRIIARGDLGWYRSDGTWLLVEIDGVGVHAQPDALFHDRSRQNRIALTGRHTLLRFTASDLRSGQMIQSLRPLF